MPGKGLKGLLGSFVEITDDPSKEGAPPPAAQRTAPRSAEPLQLSEASSAPGPDVITSLLGGTTAQVAKSAPRAKVPAVPSATSSRVPQLLQMLAAHLPANNALAELATTEKTLETAIADPTIRRQTAVSLLANKGITEKDLQAARAQVALAIEKYFDDLAAQTKLRKTNGLAQTRDQAQAYRAQVDEIATQISKLESERQTLNDQADSLDREAEAAETDLDTLAGEIETAREAARATYSNA